MADVWVRFNDHRDYPIVVKTGALKTVGPLAGKRTTGRVACLVTHPRIHRLYGRTVERSLRGAGFVVHVLPVPEGETTKSLAWAERLIGRMIALRVDRSAVVIALGGGVVGDLAGFVAATYMRGLDFIQVPTTLLAQVDSSVGGKVAVNHPRGKNLIGAFLQPRLVVTDPLVLKTLAPRQLRAGLAEMIKAASIQDARFFSQLEREVQRLTQLDMRALTPAIARACAIKGRVVEKDETEQNLRAILNYGHTFGHALETYHAYGKYLHGEAVALGMVIAARLAESLHICSTQTAERQISVLKMAGLPIKGKGENIGDILSVMKIDKKVRSGENNFILTPKIGNARIVKKIPSFSVRRVLKAVLGGT